MLLANLLNAKSILHLSESMAREEVYRTLVERICYHRELPICGEALLSLILERDQDNSPAYPTGIAIPHIRMENIEDTMIGMAFLQNPLDYDGTKVSWVCLVISDKSSSNLYLNLVASLLKISKDAHLMRELGELSDGQAVVQRLRKMEIQIKKELTIADIMVTEIFTISTTARLTELSVLLCSKSHSFIPVVDDKNHYLGEVNILRLLKVGVPDYLMMLDNLSFLSSYEPLERLFEQEDLLTVGDIMSREEEFLRPQTSIPEAVFEMIQRGKRFFSVVDSTGKLVGVVTAMDIFRKVIKA